jgi:hypothetical protein
MMRHPTAFNTPPEVSKLGRELFGFDRNTFWRELLPLLHETMDKGIIEQRH